MKIALVGLPSCGKTTVAKDLVARVEGAIYVPEIARLYINSIGRKLTGDDNYVIGKLQYLIEKKLEKPDKLTVCEIPVYASAAYDHLYNNQKHAVDLFRLNKPYDIVFNLVDTPKYVEDGTRYQTQDDLFKLNILLDKYSLNNNVVNIFGIDRKKRIEDIIKKLEE